jgi:hypothetical protein
MHYASCTSLILSLKSCYTTYYLVHTTYYLTYVHTQILISHLSAHLVVTCATVLAGMPAHSIAMSVPLAPEVVIMAVGVGRPCELTCRYD